MIAASQDLKRMREQRGLSPARMASLLGVEVSEVSRWESGSRRLSMHTLVRVSFALYLTDAEIAGLVRLAHWED